MKPVINREAPPAAGREHTAEWRDADWSKERVHVPLSNSAETVPDAPHVPDASTVPDAFKVPNEGDMTPFK